MDVWTIVIIAILVINSVLLISLIVKITNNDCNLYLYLDETKKDLREYLQKFVDDSRKTLNGQVNSLVIKSNADIKDAISREKENLTGWMCTRMNQMDVRLSNQQRREIEWLIRNIMEKHLEELSDQIKKDVDSLRTITAERIPDLRNRQLSEENQSVTNSITGSQDNLINDQNSKISSGIKLVKLYDDQNSEMTQDTNDILSQTDKNIDNLE